MEEAFTGEKQPGFQDGHLCRVVAGTALVLLLVTPSHSSAAGLPTAGPLSPATGSHDTLSASVRVPVLHSSTEPSIPQPLPLQMRLPSPLHHSEGVFASSTTVQAGARDPRVGSNDGWVNSASETLDDFRTSRGSLARLAIPKEASEPLEASQMASHGVIPNSSTALGKGQVSKQPASGLTQDTSEVAEETRGATPDAVRHTGNVSAGDALRRGVRDGVETPETIGSRVRTAADMYRTRPEGLVPSNREGLGEGPSDRHVPVLSGNVSGVVWLLRGSFPVTAVARSPAIPVPAGELEDPDSSNEL